MACVSRATRNQQSDRSFALCLGTHRTPLAENVPKTCLPGQAGTGPPLLAMALTVSTGERAACPRRSLAAIGISVRPRPPSAATVGRGVRVTYEPARASPRCGASVYCRADGGRLRFPAHAWAERVGVWRRRLGCGGGCVEAAPTVAAVVGGRIDPAAGRSWIGLRALCEPRLPLASVAAPFLGGRFALTGSLLVLLTGGWVVPRFRLTLLVPAFGLCCRAPYPHRHVLQRLPHGRQAPSLPRRQ